MPTFLDESGDTGPIKSGGSVSFRLAAVWVPTIAVANEFREKIRRLRSRLALPETFEFKYTKTHRNTELRRAFLEQAMTLKFRFAVSSLDKTHADWTRATRLEQHWACITELAAILRPTYRQVVRDQRSPLKDFIVVDDNGDRAFLALVKRQFRGLKSPHPSGSSMIDKVAFRTSDSDEMLQLVDMVCGAVGGMIDDRNRESYDQIADRDLVSQSRA